MFFVFFLLEVKFFLILPLVNHNTEDEKNSTDDDKIPEKDTQFFERVKIETKDALIRNKIKERIHNRLTDEVITKIQFNETLEKKDKEIESLKEEVLKLKQELLTVKSRNKKLCSILGQGESKIYYYYHTNGLLLLGCGINFKIFC